MALSFLFGGDTQETPDSIKRKRELVRAIMGASNAPRNIGEGLNALGDGIVANVLDRRADAAEKTGTDAANSLFNSIMGTPTGPTPAGGANGMPMPGAASELPQSTSATSAPPTDISGTEAYIREAAVKRGIDPDIAVKVARSEGLAPGVWQSNIVKDGKREPSYGPFQLYTGGGLGNKFQRVYGKSPADPSTVNQQIDFALDEAATGGWSPWYGAAKVGVGSRDGLQNARALGYQPRQTGQQVASLDPSVGMPSSGPIAPPPVNQPPPAPTPGYVDPKVVNVSRAPVQGPPRPAPELPPPTTIANAPQVDAQPSVATPSAPPQQVAQNAPQPQGQFSGVDPRLLQALQNPWLNAGQKQAVQILIQQQMQAAQQQQEEQTWRAREDYKLNSQKADPSYQLDQEYKRAQLEALKAKTGKRANVTNLGDGWLYDNDEGKAFRPQDEVQKPTSGFRFGGNSVEAQALNGLMDSGQLTEDQAQQLAAGKTITDPSTGATMFLTPQGIFQQQGQRPAPQQQPYVDLFGDGGANAPAPAPVPVPPAAPTPTVAPPAPPTAPATGPVSSTNPGIIPLTGGKPQKLLTEAERKNQSLFSVIKPELQVVESNFDALTDPNNQIFAKMPFSEFVTTPEYQQAANSLQTIVSSYLYSVSGATATPDEVKKQTDILTPRPGESKESIQNKKRRIRTMVNAVAQAGSLPAMEEPAATTPPAAAPSIDDLLKKYGTQ